MTSLERNPFIQDVERQQVRSRFSQRFASRVWTAIVSIFVIVAFTYVINLFGIRRQKPHDVSGPVRRWPVNTDAPKIFEEVPYDRPVRQWPTNEASPMETGIMQNNRFGTINWTTSIWTFPIWTSIPELASQSSTTVQAEHRLQDFESTIDSELTSTVQWTVSITKCHRLHYASHLNWPTMHIKKTSDLPRLLEWQLFKKFQVRGGPLPFVSQQLFRQ